MILLFGLRRIEAFRRPVPSGKGRRRSHGGRLLRLSPAADGKPSDHGRQQSPESPPWLGCDLLRPWHHLVTRQPGESHEQRLQPTIVGPQRLPDPVKCPLLIGSQAHAVVPAGSGSAPWQALRDIAPKEERGTGPSSGI